jgi:hypothetical protein
MIKNIIQFAEEEEVNTLKNFSTPGEGKEKSLQDQISNKNSISDPQANQKLNVNKKIIAFKLDRVNETEEDKKTERQLSTNMRQNSIQISNTNQIEKFKNTKTMDSSADSSSIDKVIINDDEEKVLNKFLKFSHLIEEKKMRHQVIKEDVVKKNNVPVNIPQDESDDDDNLVRIINEIDKEPIIENSSYFMDGDVIKYKAIVKSKKRKKNMLVGLHELVICRNKKGLLHKGQDDDESDDNDETSETRDEINLNSNMDLDAFYSKLK